MFNEVETIRHVVERVLATDLAHEVLIVDDASTDGTRDVLLELESTPGVRVFMHGYNKGKGAALRTAFEHAAGDIVLIQDADLEYSPDDYPSLLEPIEAGDADVVYGSRFLVNARQDPSWIHRFGNAALTWLSNRTTGLRLTDMETCYKVFRRGALRDLRAAREAVWLRARTHGQVGTPKVPVPRSTNSIQQPRPTTRERRSTCAMDSARSTAFYATRGSIDETTPMACGRVCRRDRVRGVDCRRYGLPGRLAQWLAADT